jgi:hypothetical protein
MADTRENATAHQGTNVPGQLVESTVAERLDRIEGMVKTLVAAAAETDDILQDQEQRTETVAQLALSMLRFFASEHETPEALSA